MIPNAFYSEHGSRDRAEIQQLVAMLREAVPEIELGSDWIVGFPGETDSDFMELCDFIREQRFDHVGVFLCQILQ